MLLKLQRDYMVTYMININSFYIPISLSFWLEVPLCDTNDIFFTWTFQMLATEKDKSTLTSYHVNQEGYVLK